MADDFPLGTRRRAIAVAPMMEWTDRHCRVFHRSLTQHAWLYTEMVTTGALIHGDVPRHLDFSPQEHPLALQLGGSDLTDLAACARLAAQWGYDEVNLNCGCPSPRVQRGAFGACLMAEPQLVADCMKAMQDAVSIDVTIKHRIGIGAEESYSPLRDFVGTIAEAGCRVFIVHARNAILEGLSPKENREIPPLKYDYVYQLKRDFPHVDIILNGGVKSLAEADAHLQHVDGVMIGREAYHNPFLLAEVDARYYQSTQPAKTRSQAIEAMVAYVQTLSLRSPEHPHAPTLNSITRHMLGLMNGLPNAKRYRQCLSDPTKLAQGQPELLLEALRQVL